MLKGKIAPEERAAAKLERVEARALLSPEERRAKRLARNAAPAGRAALVGGADAEERTTDNPTHLRTAAPPGLPKQAVEARKERVAKKRERCEKISGMTLSERRARAERMALRKNAKSALTDS